jgi:[acyl-carrier-protein] S-malonyltransferase
MRTLETLGVTATIELSPAGTLTGLIRRALPEVAAVALRTPEDLPAAAELIAEHGEQLATHTPQWRVVVAPAGGTVRIPPARLDQSLGAGDVVAHVATRTEDLAVTASEPGRIIELLVHDGDPVSQGQPLARMTGDRT